MGRADTRACCRMTAAIRHDRKLTIGVSPQPNLHLSRTSRKRTSPSSTEPWMKPLDLLKTCFGARSHWRGADRRTEARHSGRQPSARSTRSAAAAASAHARRRARSRSAVDTSTRSTRRRHASALPRVPRQPSCGPSSVLWAAGPGTSTVRRSGDFAPGWTGRSARPGCRRSSAPYRVASSGPCRLLDRARHRHRAAVDAAVRHEGARRRGARDRVRTRGRPAHAGDNHCLLAPRRRVGALVPVRARACAYSSSMA